jgi:hypothetical protein
MIKENEPIQKKEKVVTLISIQKSILPPKK